MDPLSWILATFGPVWGAAILAAITVFGPTIMRRLKDSPLKTLLAKVFAVLGKPAVPAPATPALPNSSATPLRDVLDKIRLLFKDHPAAEVIPPEDPGNDVSRLAAIRMFVDQFAGQKEAEAVAHANLLRQFRIPPAQPVTAAATADSPDGWNGGVNLVGKKLAVMLAVGMVFLLGGVGCSSADVANERPAPPAMKANADCGVCDCTGEKMADLWRSESNTSGCACDSPPVQMSVLTSLDESQVTIVKHGKEFQMSRKDFLAAYCPYTGVVYSSCVCGSSCKCSANACPASCPSINAPPIPLSQ